MLQPKLLSLMADSLIVATLPRHRRTRIDAGWVQKGGGLSREEADKRDCPVAHCCFARTRPLDLVRDRSRLEEHFITTNVSPEARTNPSNNWRQSRFSVSVASSNSDRTHGFRFGTWPGPASKWFLCQTLARQGPTYACVICTFRGSYRAGMSL